MSLSAGVRLGPYEILTQVGAGGMGEVYRARDTRLERIVAIKVSSAEFGERFEREARAVAALNHPHICTLHDIGPNYLVMEYIDGAPLRGPLPAAEALRLALQIAGALEAAHRKGIIHRDLKPGNILVTAGGVKLLDFGLATVGTTPGPNDPTLTQTRDGAIVGTAAYMSPEQANGQRADARSDIFSFGIVLYEALCGQRPFRGDSLLATLTAILSQEPRPLRQAAPDVPEPLERIVARCLNKDPARRFQTATDLRLALEDTAESRPSERIPSIAVLPFANMSGGKSNEYFSDGLAEEILNALTKVPGLRVTARTSSFSFKGRNEDTRRIGEALGVAHILEGSVRKAGNRMRVTAQLVAAADGCHLWSERYDREMTDIFAIQDEIAKAIVDVLQVKLTGKEPPAGGRHNPPIEARQAYMEGQYYLFQNTDEALVRKVESFTRATELDPGYAEPHFGLAQHYLILALFFHTRPREAMPKALAAADRAIEIDPQDWRGYYIRGVYRAMFDYDWTCAGRDLDRAVEMHPAAAMARHGRAFFYLIPLGRTEEALKEERLALESDPLSIPVRGAEALLLYSLGRDQDAAQRARTGLGLFPGVWVAAWIFGHVLNRLGFADEAAAAIENALGKAPRNPWLLATLALTHSRRGQSGEAAGILAQLDELSAQQYVSPLAIALANAGAGEVDGTFRYLDRAVEERDPMLAWFVRDPLIAKLPAGGRYQALLHSMNLA